MNFLPKELENIIVDYKDHFEYQELLKQHQKKFRKSLTIIKKLRNISFQSTHNSEATITIGPLTHQVPRYVYCHCFRICLLCHNIRASSRMYKSDMADRCKCKC